MRVLYIHQHFSTPKGSAGTRSYEFAKALIRAGHSVTMVCGRHAMSEVGASGAFENGLRRSDVEGIQVHEIDIPYSNHDGFLKRAWKFLQFSYRVSKVALKESYDLIFTTSTPLTVGIPGILAKRIRGKPFVFEVRDLWPELPKAMKVITNPVLIGLMKMLELCSYRMADALIGLSPGICAGIKKIVPGARIRMIPNGCDEIFDLPKQATKPSGFAATDFVAVFTGAHGLANGLDAVLDAAVVLKYRGIHHIKFLFVGDGKLKPELKKRAMQEGLDNCVFWDPIPKLELVRLLQSVDVGLMILDNVPAFYYGTSPNKFFDYIAAGLPVLNNYPGWLAGMITEFQCGVAVKPGDAAGFAAALIQMSNDAAQLETMRANARRLAHLFDRAHLANQCVALIEEAYEKSI